MSNLAKPIQLKYLRNSCTDKSLLMDLPPELVLVVIQLLSHKDQQTFSLLSRSSRQLALPILLRKLMYSKNVAHQIENINQANVDAKAAIRELFLIERPTRNPLSIEPILFQFLKSLPNLQSFRWYRHSNPKFVPNHHNQLVASLKHCPLEHFEYWTPQGEVPCGPVTAPSGLKSLAGKFHHAYLYNVIQPSFSTLVELQIRTYFPGSCYYDSRVPDLLPLRPVGRTLQRFFYKSHNFDPSILDTIPDVFPNLTCLQLTVYKPGGLDSQWKKSYDDSISRNAKLQFLFVDASGFVFCDANHQCNRDCPGCVDRRFNAACALAKCCTELTRCIWGDTDVRYAFDVKSRNSADGNTLQVERDPSCEPYRIYAQWSTLVFPDTSVFY